MLHTSTSIGRPSTPPISSLMNFVAAITAWLSSGYEPAAVFSWLIMPRRIGVPVAAVGSSGTWSANEDSRAQASRSSVHPLSTALGCSAVSGSGSLHAVRSERGQHHPSGHGDARQRGSSHEIPRFSYFENVPSTHGPATLTGPWISEMNTV